MIDLKKFRIIDLTQELCPGVLKVNGKYLHGYGEPPYGNRRLELRQWIYEPDHNFMHWIETETHIGTHIEVPYHLNINGKEGGKSVSEFPIENWIGEAIILNFSDKKPINGKGQPITVEDLKGVKEGDIVILWSTYKGEERPYITVDAQEFLIKKKIKQLAYDDRIGIELEGGIEAHNRLLKNDIAFIEGLVNLDQIKKERVFYIGLPLRWQKLDACPIRAIVLEPLL